MKTKILKTLLLCSLILLFSGCGKDEAGHDGSDDGGSGSVLGELLGTYELDGTEYGIHTAVCTYNGSAYTFLFSPEPSESAIDTYVSFSVLSYWADGDIHKVNDTDEALDHNDDYVFVYEDSERFYPPYDEPRSGSFAVTVMPDDLYIVQIDFVLPDGKQFQMNFSGEIPTSFVGE